jgi:hypothetical protein
MALKVRRDILLLSFSASSSENTPGSARVLWPLSALGPHTFPCPAESFLKVWRFGRGRLWGEFRNRLLERVPQLQFLFLLARRLSISTVSALRFFFTVTLGRADAARHLTFVHEPRELPVVLSPEEVARLAAPGVKYKAALSVAYGAGLRVS